MIIEIEKLGKDELLSIVVSSIESVEIESEWKEGNSWKYDVVIITDRQHYRVWCNSDEAYAKKVYMQVRDALNKHHSRDQIGEEIRKYLKTLKE